MSALLTIEGLTIEVPVGRAKVAAVRDVSLDVRRNETVALVGESGSGKTLTALSVMGLLPTRLERRAARFEFDGIDLLTARPRAMRALRGNRIGMVFQEPMTALNPCIRVGEQIAEVVLAHERVGRGVARRRAADLMGRVGIAAARTRMDDYPHQFSGGMRQRIVIAMALACDPELLIADEPTTALDVTVQAQIIALLAELRDERQMALLLITHDFGLVAEVADRVAVMYGGDLAEIGPVARIFDAPRHPYTRALLDTVPRIDVRREAGRSDPRLRAPPWRYASGLSLLDALRARRRSLPDGAPAGKARRRHAGPPQPLLGDGVTARLDLRSPEGGATRDDLILRVEALETRFRVGKRWLHAVDGVSLDVERGEAFGVVGESGCGKSTLARTVLMLEAPHAGTVRFEGETVAPRDRAAMRRLRRGAQIVFQDPYAALNPKLSVGYALAEPLRVHAGLGKHEARARVEAVLREVGLPSEAADRYPHAFSGGQRQRIGIARSLMLEPSLLIADEPVSALDVSIQAQILKLLRELQHRRGLTVLFIAHDLGVVRQFCDRVAVMYLGRLVETGPVDAVFDEPAHPYAQLLRDSSPVPNPAGRGARVTPIGEPASALDPPPGCRFHPRCPHAWDRCRTEDPALRPIGGGRQAACHLHDAGDGTPPDGTPHGATGAAAGR